MYETATHSSKFQATTVHRYIGSDAPKIIFISTTPFWNGRPFSDSSEMMLRDYASRAKIDSNDIAFYSLIDEICPNRDVTRLSIERQHAHVANALIELHLRSAIIYVPTDDFSLQKLTGKHQLHKWHLSILSASALPNGPKCIPLLHPESINKDFSMVPFMIFGMKRLRDELQTRHITKTERAYIIKQPLTAIIDYLKRMETEEFASVDIENNLEEITCIAFSPNEREAISIPTRMCEWNEEEYFVLWSSINRALRAPSKKVFQNFIHDCTHLSAYGIAVQNLWHDTMLGQRALNCELPADLATLARLYTKEPYWKDEGSDWKTNEKDYDQFWTYNAKDALHTLEIAHVQRKDMRDRNLTEVFENRVMQLCGPAAEMSWRGFPINANQRLILKDAFDTEVRTTTKKLRTFTDPVMGGIFNPRSPQQVKLYFARKKYRIPVKHGKETTDITAILKLREKHPEDESLSLLVKLSKTNKLISTYLKPEPYPDNRIRSTFVPCATDTNRWRSNKDAWDRGFNGQTVSRKVKYMFEAPEGWTWLDPDLKQADARVVAWESADPKLLQFFREGRDIHRYVASLLMGKPEADIIDIERQLGKKSGHAANYGVGGNTFSDACLKELDVVITPAQSETMIETYLREFEGVAQRHRRIQAELKRCKKLTTPLGRERYFYGRLDDNTYRAAYAWSPQSIVNDVVCELIKHVAKHRDPEKLHFIAQVHDSAPMLCRLDYVAEVTQMIFDEKTWNPVMKMMGGDLVIPVELKAGSNWSALKEVHNA